MSHDPSVAVDLPEAAWWVAVSTLPEVGPKRLHTLRAKWSGPEAWDRILSGTAGHDPGVAQAIGFRADAITSGWRAAAQAASVSQIWQRHLGAGIGVALIEDRDFPEPFFADIEPPDVLFSKGDLACIDGPRVGVVGTRKASRYGREVAHELGFDLARAGVRVVSGLALGIDGAAHRGALAAGQSGLAAPPIGVVAGGLDVVYPPDHTGLYREVAERGVLLSEAPLGQRPQKWRFPARNRLIAALADALVVVESPLKGGSLLSADEAATRGRTVFAVPGSVRSPGAAGTHKLLYDGAQLCRDADDVLLELGIQPGGRRGPPGARLARSPADQSVLDAVGWTPATLEQIAVRANLPLVDLAAAVSRLEAAGRLVCDDGWFEQVANGGSR